MHSETRLPNNSFKVFFFDLLPEKVSRYPSAFIANVDPSSKPGSHWVAFYFTKDQKGEFFDSYGQAPGGYSGNFNTFLELNSKEWSSNQKQLQGLNSSVCGQYCIYYVVKRRRGNNLNSIVQPFVKNKQINDAFVDEFVTKYVESKTVTIKQVSLPNKLV